MRRDAGSGAPDPGWAQDWTGRLRTLLAEAAAQGMPATDIVRECQAAMADFDFPVAGAEGERKRKLAMSAASLAAVSPVLVVGALTCLVPAVTRPTLQFGVRVPRERAGAPVIGRERRAYYWRTAAIGVCCTLVAVTVRGYGSWWLTRIILLPELAADLGCFWAARRKIAAVKNADNWFAGLQQTIVTDTSWRTDPPRFPVRWLLPALAVMAATAAVGALRYPGLPAHIVTGSGHRVPKSAVSVLVVVGQLYFTAVYSGLMLIVHRSRPDIEAADPAASALRYRRFLAATTRALLTMAALADLGLLLIALPDWQVYRLPGIGRAR